MYNVCVITRRDGSSLIEVRPHGPCTTKDGVSIVVKGSSVQCNPLDPNGVLEVVYDMEIDTDKVTDTTNSTTTTVTTTDLPLYLPEAKTVQKQSDHRGRFHQKPGSKTVPVVTPPVPSAKGSRSRSIDLTETINKASNVPTNEKNDRKPDGYPAYTKPITKTATMGRARPRLFGWRHAALGHYKDAVGIAVW